jgi:hypothetical protein
MNLETFSIEYTYPKLAALVEKKSTDELQNMWRRLYANRDPKDPERFIIIRWMILNQLVERTGLKPIDFF